MVNGNNWQYCKAIIGHKETKDLLESKESGKIKIYTGSSIACESEDFIYTCIVDERGLFKLKEFKYEFILKHDPFNRLA